MIARNILTQWRGTRNLFAYLHNEGERLQVELLR